MKKSIATTLAALGIATTSYAGSPSPIEPEAVVITPAATSWDGFYAGATYGIGVGGDMVYDTLGVLITYPSLEDGSSYGAFAGYNVQRNNLVFGGEVAYSQVDGFGPVGFPDEGFNYFIDGKARVGYAMDNMLFYGFAGYSMSEFHRAGGSPTFPVSGLNYGAGVDMMLGGNMFVGAEFIVRDLSGDTPNVNQVQNTNIQALQLRAGWKF